MPWRGVQIGVGDVQAALRRQQRNEDAAGPSVRAKRRDLVEQDRMVRHQCFDVLLHRLLYHLFGHVYREQGAPDGLVR